MGSNEDDSERLQSERYGEYDETPHTSISISFQQYDEVLKEVLEYRLGPPVAWSYNEGTLFVWGDELDEVLLSGIADACSDLESEHAHGGHYETAQAARAATSLVLQAEVYPPGERVRT